MLRPLVGCLLFVSGLVPVFETGGGGGDSALLLHEFLGSPLDDFASAVSAAGDVDGDGFDDLVVGLPLGGGAGQGAVRVYSGATGQMIGIEIVGTTSGGQFGHSVCVIGDLDDDGREEFVVGAPNDTDASGLPVVPLAGSVNVYSYNGASFSAHFTFYGDPVGGTRFGHAVASAGFSDEDTLPDIAVGAPLADAPLPDSGEVFIFRGSDGTEYRTAKGINSQEKLGWAISRAGRIDAGDHEELVLGGPGASIGVARIFSPSSDAFLSPKMESGIVADGFGLSVGGGGDLTNDGVPDVVIGAPLDDGSTGAAYVFSGKTKEQLHVYRGGAALDEFGHAVAVPGDVNGDARVDVLIGAPQSSANLPGYAVVYSGRQYMADHELMRMTGGANGGRFGLAVRGAGDVNGDCATDVIVGGPLEGAARVFGHDFGGAPSANRLLWTNGPPIKDTLIEAYYITENAEIAPLPLLDPDEPTRSGDDGRFCWPPEMTGQGLQSDEKSGKRFIRARLEYTETTADDIATQRTIVNYPNWDPLWTLKGGNTITGPVTISVPTPVFFQPGVSGKVNKGPGGYTGSAGKLRAFMILDSGATNDEIEDLKVAYGTEASVAELKNWRKIKRGQWTTSATPPLPAFLFFAMPSKQDDDVSWGYNNQAFQTVARVQSSGKRMEDHYDDRIVPEIEKLTDANALQVKLSVMGHSLGGILLREWFNHQVEGGLSLDRFVSFDSPQGGLSALAAVPVNFFSEAHLNGTSGDDDEPPEEEDKGWNYCHDMTKQDPYHKVMLFLSASENVFIEPDSTGTAFAIGRIMAKPELSNGFTWWNHNGYCESFAGGYRLDVDETGKFEGHSIQNRPKSIVTAVRFLATGEKPYIGNDEDIADDAVFAVLGGEEGDHCPGLDDGSASPPSHVRHALTASANTTTSEALFFDSNTTLGLSAYVTPASATIEVKDSGGNPIAHQGEETVTGEGEGYSIYFDFDVTEGAPGSFELTAGAEDAEAYVVVDYPDDLNASVHAVDDHLDEGAQTTLVTRMLDAGLNDVSGTGAVVTVLVDKPDDTTTAVDLFDDGLHEDGIAGDEIFGGFFSDTSRAGRYHVRSDFQLDLSTGERARRSGAGQFIVDPDGADLIGVVNEVLVDAGGDPTADYIRIDVDVLVMEPGNYRILAGLSDQNGFLETIRTGFTSTMAEVRTASLIIDAERVHAAGGGAFTLDPIQLLDDDAELIITSMPPYDTLPQVPAAFDLPEPMITACIPHRADGGEEIVLYGTDLEHVSGVQFGGTPATSFEITGPGTIRVVTPDWTSGPAGAALGLLTPYDPDPLLFPGCFTFKPATLGPDDILLKLGSIVSGDAGSLAQSDDVSLVVVEEQLQICVDIGLETELCAALFDLQLEAGGSVKGIDTTISIHNWDLDTWEVLGGFTLEPEDERLAFAGLASSSFVRASDGRIEVRFESTAPGEGVTGVPGGSGSGSVFGPSAGPASGGGVPPGFGPPVATRGPGVQPSIRIDLARVTMTP